MGVEGEGPVQDRVESKEVTLEEKEVMMKNWENLVVLHSDIKKSADRELADDLEEVLDRGRDRILKNGWNELT